MLKSEMAKATVRSVPHRKISETFLDYSAPLLQGLPSEALEHHVREALKVSFTTWNAVIFSDVLNDNQYVDQIRRLTADRPEVALMIEQMIDRKRALFANDARLIGDWEVTRTKDGINLHADARDPHSLRRGSSDQH